MVAWGWRWEWELTLIGQERLFGGDGIVPMDGYVIVAQLGKLKKHYGIVHLKLFNSI